MKYDPRRGRALFLAYICCAYVLVLVAAPLATALDRSSILSASSASSGSNGPPSGAVTFERLDRNRDGFIGKAEANRLPGLPAAFARADANADGKLDKVEFARALSMLEAGK
jgi:hypothetical protein